MTTPQTWRVRNVKLTLEAELPITTTADQFRATVEARLGTQWGDWVLGAVQIAADVIDDDLPK